MAGSDDYPGFMLRRYEDGWLRHITLSRLDEFNFADSLCGMDGVAYHWSETGEGPVCGICRDIYSHRSNQEEADDGASE